MANFFDQFDGGEASPTPASGVMRITVTPPQVSPPSADAISRIESGGNYGAVGPETGKGRALGKYQVMSFNVGPWTREALGTEMTPGQFLQSPEAQDAVFKYKFGQYEKKHGPEGAARAWFAGEGGMNDMGRRDVLGTSVADYSRKFTNSMGTPSQTMSAKAKAGPNFFDQFDGGAQAPAEPDTVPELPSSNGLPGGLGPRAGREEPQVSTMGAAGRGVMQGLTANFYDELQALTKASGVKGMGIDTLLVGFYKKLTGDPEFAQKFEQALSEERQYDKSASQQHPIANTMGQVGGAIAMPVGPLMNAATLPARIGRGAAVGAGMGAAFGAGEGDGLEDRASRALTGGVVGAGVGAVAPPLVEGVLQGTRAAATPIVNAVRGAVNPDAEAARRVATAVTRDVRTDPGAVSRLTPGEFGASAQSGGPATIMDLGGETTRALARSAANTSPEGRQALNSAINDRFDRQSGRLIDWLNSRFNYPDAAAWQEAIDQAQKAVSAKYYKPVFAANPVVTVPSDITSRPAVAQAMKDAVSLARNYGEKLQSPKETRTILSGDGYHIADDIENSAKTSLQYWDYVKKALDARINRAKRNGGFEDLNGQQKADLRGLIDAKNALVQHLDSAVPAYKAARAGAAALFNAENALEAGQKFVSAKMANAEARKALAQMSDVDRKLFTDGFVSRFIEKLNETGDRRNVLNAVAQSPAARERLAIALGPQRAAELEAGLRVEGIMDLARGAVQGNSTTARQLAELGFAGGAGSLGAYGTYNQDPAQMTYAAVAAALLAGKRGIDTRVAQRVARMLVSNDPRQLTQGIQLISRNGRMMDALRSVDQRLSRVGSTQAPTTGVLPQLPAIGRADSENDQPTVPRPPG